jgi:hypothetical protein
MNKSTTGENPLLGLFHYRDLPDDLPDGVHPYQDCWCGHLVCPICGNRYTASHTKALVVAGGVGFGDVCEDCMAAGPEKMASHLRRSAKAAEEEAKTAEAKLLTRAAENRRAADALEGAFPWHEGNEAYCRAQKAEAEEWEAEERAAATEVTAAETVDFLDGEAARRGLTPSEGT